LATCPCGRRGPDRQVLPYEACCGPYHHQLAEHPAPDAEALMRSRYSAFVMQREDYLLATWHSSRRPSGVRFDAGVKWLGLEVRDHHQVDECQAEVEFVARQRDTTGRAVRLHERSRFVRQADGDVMRWFYLDGDWR